MCRGPYLMPPLSLIQYETNGFFIFLQNSNLELKVFVEDSLNFTDNCVTQLEIRSQFYLRRLSKTRAKFYLQKLKQHNRML